MWRPKVRQEEKERETFCPPESNCTQPASRTLLRSLTYTFTRFSLHVKTGPLQLRKRKETLRSALNLSCPCRSAPGRRISQKEGRATELKAVKRAASDRSRLAPAVVSRRGGRKGGLHWLDSHSPGAKPGLDLGRTWALRESNPHDLLRRPPPPPSLLPPFPSSPISLLNGHVLSSQHRRQGRPSTLRRPSALHLGRPSPGSSHPVQRLGSCCHQGEGRQEVLDLPMGAFACSSPALCSCVGWDCYREGLVGRSGGGGS